MNRRKRTWWHCNEVVIEEIEENAAEGKKNVSGTVHKKTMLH